MRGASDAELRNYNLGKDSNKYHYINQGSYDVLSEKDDYISTNNAFKILGFTANEIAIIWCTVAAILHLGNIEFQSKSLKHEEFKLITKIIILLTHRF